MSDMSNNDIRIYLSLFDNCKVPFIMIVMNEYSQWNRMEWNGIE